MAGHNSLRGCTAVVLIVSAWPTVLFGQNLGFGTDLISNGSFEERFWCPVDYTQSQLKTIVDWNQANAGTPDHFDACSTGGKAGVPDNMFGS